MTLIASKVKETGKPATLGADKAYDVTGTQRNASLTRCHTASGAKQRHDENRQTRTPIVDDKTAASEGYGMSQTRRKMIECVFGWRKQHGTLRKTKHQGITRVAGDFFLNLIA